MIDPGKVKAPTSARHGAPGRRRTGRGWWASHHRRGRPRPPRYGSSAAQAWQWRGGVRLARRASVADAAIASSASALTDRPLAKIRQESRNPAEGTHSRGASLQASARPRGYPAPAGRSALGGVARAAQHRRVRDVEGRTARGERDHVVDGQVRCPVDGAAVARAPVAALAAPGAQHAGAQALPGPRLVQGAVPARAGLPRVRGAAAARAAGDDAADRAQPHPRIVGGKGGAVYSPQVLRLRAHGLSGD